MAYAQELKNLASEIKTSHKDRTAGLGKIKRETKDILEAADGYMRKVAAELKETARDLKDFLAKSEEIRKKDFNAMMGEIQARIKDIKGDVKDFLAKSEGKRMVDFKAMMKDVAETVGAIRRTTKGLLSDYKAERKEAAGYWAALARKEAPEAAPAPAPKAKAKKRK